jgi:ribose transport system ATP-binding protein
VAEHYTVLRDGETIGSGPLAGTSEADIVALMVGRSVDDLFPCVPHTPGEEILSVRGLSGQRAPRDVTFSLRRGEILGIAGLIGAGRTELLRALFGLDPTIAGQVLISDRAAAATPAARIRASLGLVSEDRKGEGLAQDRSIADNMTLTALPAFSRWGWLDLACRDSVVRHWMARLQVKARGPSQSIGDLSGGNQQKVAIARVLLQGAEVVLLDEPTRGIDVSTKAEIYRLIGELAAEGKAVIFVSSYLPELMAVCDRIGVMSRGRLREIRAAQDWTEETVMACAVSAEG